MMHSEYQSNFPLRYRISDFRQLKDCKSNNSVDLCIKVTTFLNDPRLNALRIQVVHPEFGVLFACLIEPSGTILTKPEDGDIYYLTPGQILDQLRVFGFLIEYNPVTSISGNQLDYLVLLSHLHYDKIRVMSVWTAPLGVKEFTTHIVAFNADAHGDWLNAGYSASSEEFTKGLYAGTVLDISAISETQNYDWSWLYGWVGDIDDILNDRLGCVMYEP